MRWSFSAHGSFRKCPRQWFYKKVYANGRAKDPQRREAHRLSKLDGIQAWRGKIVDAVISYTIIPSVAWKRPCGLETSKRKADELFDLQRTQRLNGVGDGRFLETEYGNPITEEMFQKARAEVHTALENFYRTEGVWEQFHGQKKEPVGEQKTPQPRHGVRVQMGGDSFKF